MTNDQLDVLKRRKYLEYLKILPSIREEKAKAYMTLALTFAAISIFGLFAINPTLSTITQLHKQIEDMETLKEALTVKSASLSKLESSYQNIAQDISQLMIVIPQIPNAPYLMGQLLALSQKNSVTITNMQSLQVDLQKQRQENQESSFVFTVDAEGGYEDLMRFVTDLSSANRLLTYEKLTMSSAEGGSATAGGVRLSIRARAFFKP